MIIIEQLLVFVNDNSKNNYVRQFSDSLLMGINKLRQQFFNGNQIRNCGCFRISLLFWHLYILMVNHARLSSNTSLNEIKQYLRSFRYRFFVTTITKIIMWINFQIHCLWESISYATKFLICIRLEIVNVCWYLGLLLLFWHL